MLVISNTLAPYGDLASSELLDLMFIWNKTAMRTGVGWDYGYAIETRPLNALDVYRDAIRAGNFEPFSAHGTILNHDRTLPIWVLVKRVIDDLDLNSPKLQWHSSRK